MNAPTPAGARPRAMAALALVLPLLLALLAEAAWIAVLAGLLDAFALHDPVIGVPALLLAAAAGLVAARTLGPRLGDRWSPVAVGLAVAVGATGWLLSPATRDLLRAGGTDALGPALAANPGGWLAALAFVRGMAHARLPVDPQRIGTLLGAGIPGLALVAIIGGMAGEPARSDFLATAQLQVLLFLASAIAALALARLTQVAHGARIDWRRNPAWLFLLGGLVVATAAGAAWIGASSGTTIATAAGAMLVPLLVVGFVAGFDRRSVRILAISALAVAVLGVVVRAVSAPGGGPPPGAIQLPPITEGDPQAQTSIALGALAVVVIAAALLVMLLARLWLRRSPGTAALDDEERIIDHGGELDGEPRPRRRGPRLGRRTRPTDAVGAWLALVASLDGRQPVARARAETPAEHARRLRAAGHGTLALDLLAADVGLATFGRVDLRPSEHRRALARADAARATLLAVPVEPEATGAQRATAGPTGPTVRGGRVAAGPGADLPDADQPGATTSTLTRIRRGP
jgi:hypothetical protein